MSFVICEIGSNAEKLETEPFEPKAEQELAVLTREEIKKKYRYLGLQVPSPEMIEDLFINQTKLYSSKSFNFDSKTVKKQAELIKIIRKTSTQRLSFVQEEEKNPAISINYFLISNKYRVSSPSSQSSRFRFAPAGF
jgi:hypothetical protein